MGTHVEQVGTTPYRLSQRQRTVILIAINKYRLDLADERTLSSPGSLREREIDANLLAIQDLREALI